MKKIIFTLIYILMSVGSSFASEITEQADSAYNHEDYRLAIRLYLRTINEQGFSPEVYYNLANSYYRIDELGKAVLYYQRALNLDPSMKDARTNLEFVKTKIIDRQEDYSTFLTNLHDSVLESYSPNTWAWIALGLFAILIGSIAIYIFTSNVMLRKIGFFGAFIILFLTIYASIIAWQSADLYNGSNKAVVIVPTANLRTRPGENNTDKVIPIHEGTILEITDSLTMPGESSSPKWYDVKIYNSTRAWVKASDVEKI